MGPGRATLAPDRAVSIVEPGRRLAAAVGERAAPLSRQPTDRTQSQPPTRLALSLLAVRTLTVGRVELQLSLRPERGRRSLPCAVGPVRGRAVGAAERGGELRRELRARRSEGGLRRDVLSTG